MNLRLKVLIVLTCLWVGMSLLIISYSKYTLTQDYAELERSQMAASIQQTQKAIDDLMDAFKQHNADWAQWDNTYQFMQDKNQAYLDANCTGPAFKNIGVNLMLFFKPNGDLWVGLNFDNDKNAFVPVPPELITALQNEKSYLFQTEDSEGKTGFINFQNQLIVLSALPVLDSQARGPSHGTMVIGYFLTKNDTQKISALVNLKVNITPLPLLTPNPSLDKIISQLNDDQEHVVLPQNKNFISGYTFIRDAQHKPVGLLEVTSPRELSLAAKQIIKRYISIILLMGVLFMIVIWYLLKILVLDKVIKLNEQIKEIKNTGQFTRRVENHSNDEINQMASSLNDLLEIIELTQGQLKYRLSLRAEELARLALLNKNLYNDLRQHTETDLKVIESERTLKQLAYYDPITGLPNRLFFNEIVRKLISKAERDGSGLAIVMLDATRFKQIKDLYGDIVSEQFLKETSLRLKGLTQEADVIARIAGDEFIICLTNIRNKETLKDSLEAMLVRLSEPQILEGLTLHSTFCMGLSLYPNDGAKLGILEERAELALRQAEQQHKNIAIFFDEIEKNKS